MGWQLGGWQLLEEDRRRALLLPLQAGSGGERSRTWAQERQQVAV